MTYLYNNWPEQRRMRLRKQLVRLVMRRRWTFQQLRCEIEKSMRPLVAAFGTDSGWVRVPSASALHAFMNEPEHQPNEHTYGKVEWFLKTPRQRALWWKRYHASQRRFRRLRRES